MREHLFRGFHPDENGTTTITLDGKQIRGEWVEGNLFIPDDPSTPTQICMGTSTIRICYDIVPETVGEFTELTDKNSKKIFEGDIVKATVNYCGGEKCFAIGRVIFEYGTFKIEVAQSRNTVEYKQYTGADVEAYSIENNFVNRGYVLEVIGNIFKIPNYCSFRKHK